MNIVAIAIMQNAAALPRANHRSGANAHWSQMGSGLAKAPAIPVVRREGETVREYLKRSFTE
jgi:hypothetical protein